MKRGAALLVRLCVTFGKLGLGTDRSRTVKNGTKLIEEVSVIRFSVDKCKYYRHSPFYNAVVMRKSIIRGAQFSNVYCRCSAILQPLLSGS